MKRKIFLPFLFFLFFSFCMSVSTYAQDLISKCGLYFDAQDYQRAILAGKEAVKLYPSNPNAYLCLGASYLKIGQLDLAISSLKNAEKYASNEIDLMGLYNQLGMAYYYKGMLDDALFYYNKALLLEKSLGYKEAEAFCLNNIAGIFNERGELNKALSYYEEALRLITNEKKKSIIYSNIGNISYKQGNYKNAIEFFKKAIDIAEKNGDNYRYAIDEINLSSTYIEIKDLKNAEYYLFDGLKIIKKIGNKYWEATAYQKFGDLYIAKGEYNVAKNYYIKALQIFKEIGALEDANNVKDILASLNSNKNGK